MDSNENYRQTQRDATGAEYSQQQAGSPPPPYDERGTAPRLDQHISYSRKSPVLACILSGMPGLGQVYVGYYQRGFIHAAIFVILITLISSGAGSLEPLFGTSLGFFILYNIIDAGRRAVLYNQAMAGAAQIEMPEDMKMPTGGSLGGGIILTIAGVLLIMYTKFDFDMEWINEWWPLGLVGLGIHLILKSRREKRETS
jgi:hypothetical protein